MKEITENFIRNQIIEIKSENFSSNANDFPVVCHSTLALETADMRYALSYYLDRLLYHKYGALPNLILAMSPQALLGAVLLCQNTSHFRELPIVLLQTNTSESQKSQIKIDKSVCNKNVLLMEDVFSSETEVLKIANFLHRHNADVTGIVSLFSYNFPKALTALKKKKLELTTLCELDELWLNDFSFLTETQSAYLKNWQNSM